MKIRTFGIFLLGFGLDPRKFFYSVLGIFHYVKSYFLFFKQSRKSKIYKTFPISFFPVLSDLYSHAGIVKGHYFHQDLWAARRIYKNNPELHLDIGSRIDGFIAHLLSFRDVVVIDVRSIESNVEGLHFSQMDLTNVPVVSNFVADSVSCLHALEHFGLGRYGDAIDYDGWIKGIENISKMLKSKGLLYLSVPVGKQRIEFNAHRIFYPQTIINTAKSKGLSLVSFSYIDDSGMFHSATDPASADFFDYGCGCFEFIKE